MPFSAAAFWTVLTLYLVAVEAEAIVATGTGTETETGIGIGIGIGKAAEVGAKAEVGVEAVAEAATGPLTTTDFSPWKSTRPGERHARRRDVTVSASTATVTVGAST